MKSLTKWINQEDFQDNTIAHIAAYNGNIEILKLLLENNVDLKKINKKVLTKYQYYF